MCIQEALHRSNEKYDKMLQKYRHMQTHDGVTRNLLMESSPRRVPVGLLALSSDLTQQLSASDVHYLQSQEAFRRMVSQPELQISVSTPPIYVPPADLFSTQKRPFSPKPLPHSRLLSPVSITPDQKKWIIVGSVFAVLMLGAIISVIIVFVHQNNARYISQSSPNEFDLNRVLIE